VQATLTQIEQRLESELRKYMLETGVSQNAMAELAGVHASSVSRFLSGKRSGLSLETAGLLCEYLGLRLGKPVPSNKKSGE